MIARRAAWTLAALGVLLGLGHMAFLSAAPRWALDVLWFALSGVAFIVTALLNVAALRAPADRLVRGLAVGSDLVLAGFFAAAWLVLPGPQVIAGGVLFAGLAVLTLCLPGPQAERLRTLSSRKPRSGYPGPRNPPGCRRKARRAYPAGVMGSPPPGCGSALSRRLSLSAVRRLFGHAVPSRLSATLRPG